MNWGEVWFFQSFFLIFILHILLSVWRFVVHLVMIEGRAMARYKYCSLRLRLLPYLQEMDPRWEERLRIYRWCEERLEIFQKQHALVRLVRIRDMELNPIISEKDIDKMATLLYERKLPRKQALVMMSIWRYRESTLSVLPYEIVLMIGKLVYANCDDISLEMLREQVVNKN